MWWNHDLYKNTRGNHITNPNNTNYFFRRIHSKTYNTFASVLNSSPIWLIYGSPGVNPLQSSGKEIHVYIKPTLTRFCPLNTGPHLVQHHEKLRGVGWHSGVVQPRPTCATRVLRLWVFKEYSPKFWLRKPTSLTTNTQPKKRCTLFFVSIKNQRIWSSTSICFTQFLETQALIATTRICHSCDVPLQHEWNSTCQFFQWSSLVMSLWFFLTSIQCHGILLSPISTLQIVPRIAHLSLLPPSLLPGTAGKNKVYWNRLYPGFILLSKNGCHFSASSNLLLGFYPKSLDFLLHNLVPENMFMTCLMLIFVNTGFRIQANSF